MQVLQYKLLQGQDEDEKPILLAVSMPWSEANEEIAKAEAYNGEYTIVDDSEPEPAPTLEARLGALENKVDEIATIATEYDTLITELSEVYES